MAKKTWTKDSVAADIHTAIMQDVYMSDEHRRSLRNSWPATCSFTYNWLHRLTEDAMPIEGLGYDLDQPLTNIEMLQKVAFRWLEFLDNINDRKIVWWVVANVPKTEIGRRLGLEYRTVLNRFEAALDEIAKKLNAADSD